MPTSNAVAGNTTSAFLAACALMLGQLAQGQEPPKPAEPRPIKAAADVAQEIRDLQDKAIDIEKRRLREGNAGPAAPTPEAPSATLQTLKKYLVWHPGAYLATAGSALIIGMARRLLNSRIRRNAQLAQETVNARLDTITQELREPFDAAIKSLAEAEKIFLESVAYEALLDFAGRRALLELVTAQLKGPAKDKLIEALTRPPQAEAPDAIPPTMEEAFGKVLEAYGTMAEAWGAIRAALRRSGLPSAELPTIPGATALVTDVSLRVHQILGLDAATMHGKNLVDTLKDLEKKLRAELADFSPSYARPLLIVGLPIGGMLALDGLHWAPAYAAFAASIYAGWGANSRSRWTAATMAALIAFPITVGFMTNQFLLGKDAKVEAAETRYAEKAIVDRGAGELNDKEARYYAHELRSFAAAWKRYPPLAKAPCPIDFENANWAAPHPQTDTFRTLFKKAEADLTEKYGAKEAKEHSLVLWQLTARFFLSGSPAFQQLRPVGGRLTAAEEKALEAVPANDDAGREKLLVKFHQDRTVLFFAHQMRAAPTSPPEVNSENK